jgi:hypothetical protein
MFGGVKKTSNNNKLQVSEEEKNKLKQIKNREIPF